MGKRIIAQSLPTGTLLANRVDFQSGIVLIERKDKVIGFVFFSETDNIYHMETLCDSEIYESLEDAIRENPTYTFKYEEE